MSRFMSDNLMEMDTSSPLTSVQRMESSPPVASSMKSIYSKLLSSCQRSERLSVALTPENKETMTMFTSPFVKQRGPFNPFNKNLRERLENPIFSPNVFATVISPSQDSNEFKWNIDDLSKINPAPIEEEFHFEEQVDEQTETEIQRTIDKYFTKTHMVPSPWNCKLPTSWSSFREGCGKEHQLVLNEQINPAAVSPYPYSVSRLEFVSRTPCQNASTQTSLSLPADLPENLNSLLKEYCSDTSLDDINSSMNSSLRRKLFIKKDNEPPSPVSLFTFKDTSPLLNNCYPSTPVIKLRTDGSPLENFSPLDLSPINRINKKSVCNSYSSAMHMDVFVQGNSDNKLMSKENIDPSSSQVYQECSKVFESPKLVGNIRRTRKRRRRSYSQDMDMSISYSNFASKHNSTEQLAARFCVCTEDPKMSIDTYSENLMESQDTGYGSAYTASFEKVTKNDSNFKLLTFSSWTSEVQDKVLFASTPTKE